MGMHAKPVLRSAIAYPLNFTCSCGQVLIENYNKYIFPSIGIRCSVCFSVQYTDILESGETINNTILKFSSGEYGFGETIEIPPGVSITGDQQFADHQTLLRPRNAKRSFPSMHVIVEGVIEFLQKFSKKNVSAELIKVGKYGNWRLAARENPIYWSISHYKRNISQIFINSDENLAAISIIFSTYGNISCWRDHPLFNEIAKEIIGHQFHSFINFCAPCILYKNNLLCELEVRSSVRGPKTDFFVRTANGAKLPFEVKTPEALQIPHNLKVGILEGKNIIQAAISKSKRKNKYT